MKKFKLFASIASMCLAVAALCFGVYSAQNVTYTIGGSISYEVEDVFVQIETRVFKVASTQTKEEMQTAVKTLATTSLDSIANTTFVESQKFDVYDSEKGTGTLGTTGIDITYGTKAGETTAYYTYYIVINIKNLSPSRDVSAYITDTTTATNINSIKVTNTYQNRIKSTETRNIVIAYSIDNLQESVTSNFGYTLTVDYKGYNPYENLLKTDGSMWYVEYGSYSNSPIKWKYVGTMDADGTMQKYTYSSTKPTGLAGKAVFVQQSLSEHNDIGFDKNGSNNYYTSTIREQIKDGTYFNLSDEEKTLNLAMPRTISSISSIEEVSNSSDYQETTDQYRLPDSSTDKFWLMSLGEVNTYLGTDNSSRTFNNRNWWLRSPFSGFSDPTIMTMYVGIGGGFGRNPASTNECCVRAAFILSTTASI